MKKAVKRKFVQAYNKHRDELVNYLYNRTSDRSEAEDLSHDVFVKTWAYLDSGKEVENIKSFLYTVAHNLLVDFYRQRERMPIPVDMRKFPAVRDERYRDMEQEIINLVLFERFLKALNREQRKIMEMRYLEKQGIGQISNLLGYSRNHTSVILHRAGKIMKRKFNA